MTQYSTQIPVARRALFAGAAALAIGGSLPAAATPAGDDYLLDLYERWKERERAFLRAEMEARRLYQEMPDDVEDLPSVRTLGMHYYEPKDLEDAILQTPGKIERLRGSPDSGKRIAAEVIRKEIPEAKALLAVLRDKLRRKAEWNAAVGYDATLERRDDLGAEGATLLEEAMTIAPTTQRGFAAQVDMLISQLGATYDPEDDYAHSQFESLSKTLEAATGVKPQSPTTARLFRRTFRSDSTAQERAALKAIMDDLDRQDRTGGRGYA